MELDSIERLITERMTAERIGMEHLPDICRLHSDPRVMKTLSADGNVIPDDRTRAGVESAVRHWQEHGFGLWVFHSRRDGQFIGRGGLSTYRIEDADVIGLAYAVLAEHWGQGYATEMARAALGVGFDVLGLDEIASWTLPGNKPSQRVLAKLGFRYERDFVFAGLDHRLYRLKRWTIAPGGPQLTASMAESLDRHWAASLGCRPQQLHDGGRHVVVNPGPQKGSAPSRRPDSIWMMTRRRGWALSVPNHLRQRAAQLCLPKAFQELAAEGDGQYEQWFQRGARDEERESRRGPDAYHTLATLAEGLPVRCWSHYLHWYCDPASWKEAPADEHVRPLRPENPETWRQWMEWPGLVCHPRHTQHSEVSDAFGWVLDGQLVSVAQLQSDPGDFAWEFGVETLEGFARRGFGTQVARAATQRILALGQRPWYYCDHYNLPSARIPCKLGYPFYAETMESHMK